MKKNMIKIEGNHPVLKYVNKYPKTNDEIRKIVNELLEYGYEIKLVPYKIVDSKIIEDRSNTNIVQKKDKNE